MYKYYFHIIDREYGNEYDFEGYFLSHDEIDAFVADNEKVGNIVTIISPYYELVPITELPAIYANVLIKALENV